MKLMILEKDINIYLIKKKLKLLKLKKVNKLQLKNLSMILEFMMKN